MGCFFMFLASGLSTGNSLCMRKVSHDCWVLILKLSGQKSSEVIVPLDIFLSTLRLDRFLTNPSSAIVWLLYQDLVWDGIGRWQLTSLFFFEGPTPSSAQRSLLFYDSGMPFRKPNKMSRIELGTTVCELSFYPLSHLSSPMEVRVRVFLSLL